MKNKTIKQCYLFSLCYNCHLKKFLKHSFSRKCTQYAGEYNLIYVYLIHMAGKLRISSHNLKGRIS